MTRADLLELGVSATHTDQGTSADIADPLKERLEERDPRWRGPHVEDHPRANRVDILGIKGACERTKSTRQAGITARINQSLGLLGDLSDSWVHVLRETTKLGDERASVASSIMTKARIMAAGGEANV